MFHEKARPGERVKPHRHGTLQVDYVLRGELIFGNQRVSAGMGYVIPDTLYSWRAGDEGAEWIEIHAGEVGIFTERNGSSNAPVELGLAPRHCGADGVTHPQLAPLEQRHPLHPGLMQSIRGEARQPARPLECSNL